LLVRAGDTVLGTDRLGVLDARGRPRLLPGPSPAWPGLFFAGYRTAVEGTLRRDVGDARAIVRAVGSVG
jgi:hypothetical protein